MSILTLLLWAAGIVLVGVGYARARGPWQRYRYLQDQDANVARYQAWRGGLRDNEPSGASVAMQVLRRQALIGASIAVVGVVLAIAGFAVR